MVRGALWQSIQFDQKGVVTHMPSIYLSPSLQPYNKYVTTGDEQYWMNVIADDMVPILEKNGIAVTRHTPGMTLGQAIRQSNAGDYGLHLALHSNAAPESLSGKLRGPDVYYYPYSTAGKRAADIIADNLRSIYPDPDLVNTVVTTKLAEITKTNAPAVLVEIAYHDNVQDEAWIRENTALIAQNLALSVCEFFGLNCTL